MCLTERIKNEWKLLWFASSMIVDWQRLSVNLSGRMGSIDLGRGAEADSLERVRHVRAAVKRGAGCSSRRRTVAGVAPALDKSGALSTCTRCFADLHRSS